MPILGLKDPGPSQPAHFSLERLIRPNILSLQPYRCARDDYSEGVLLDANENAIGPVLGQLDPVAAQTMELINDHGLNRYPSPTHDDLKRKIAKFRGVPDENWVFLGVGSDEVIDLLFRVLCVPGKDRVMTTPPTYGMYGVTAQVNDIEVVKVPLDESFQLDEEKVSRDGAWLTADDRIDRGHQDTLCMLPWQPHWHAHPSRRHATDPGQSQVYRGHDGRRGVH